jgi:hypothetical protein
MAVHYAAHVQKLDGKIILKSQHILLGIINFWSSTICSQSVAVQPGVVL